MTTGEELDQAMLDLRARGLSYTSLTVVAEYVYGWKLTPEHLRRRLRNLGAPADERWKLRQRSAA